MSSRLAVFDCDGTLVDGQAEVCDAMEAAFVEAGLPPPSRNTVRRSVGLSLNAAMRQLVPDADEEMQRHAVECYRSEEHTSELQSLMRISYAVFCLKKKTKYKQKQA